MTENEKLRALLAEARETLSLHDGVVECNHPECRLYRFFAKGIDEALAQPAAQTSQYDENLSACHRYGLCADPKQELNAFDKTAIKNCSVCPRK